MGREREEKKVSDSGEWRKRMNVGKKAKIETILTRGLLNHDNIRLLRCYTR